MTNISARDQRLRAFLLTICTEPRSNRLSKALVLLCYYIFMEIRNCFYRISIKALVLNESRDKFLIVRENDGRWELPGGGLDWGSTPHEDLPREISEEMGVNVTWIAERPSYFLTCQNSNHEIWIANVLYEAKLENLDFTTSNECTEVRFVNAEELKELNLFSNLKIFGEMFDPKNH